MHHFQYEKGHLYCEKVKIRDVADKIGTPFYLYSARAIRHHIKLFEEAFASYPHLFCYSMKANSNLSILSLIKECEWGVDVVSGGELFRALKAGIEPSRIVYAGVGKTRPEIEMALKARILLLNVESREELEAIDRISQGLKRKTSVALRVNPDVEAKTHAYITTGKKEAKFGLSMEQTLKIYEQREKFKNVEIKGIHVHIGSQITSLEPYSKAITKVVGLIEKLNQNNIPVEWLNIGGGLGIIYHGEKVPYPQELAAKIIPEVKETGCKIIVEPGRFIVGNAGILVTRVTYVKRREDKNFVIVDAGMNDFVRPSLYGAYHEIVSEVEKEGSEIQADVVGPICESGDFFAQDRKLPEVEEGEYLVIMGAGAYGFSMSSNYNSRPRVAEVLVDGEKSYLIRRRESHLNLIEGESIPPRLLQKVETSEQE